MQLIGITMIAIALALCFLDVKQDFDYCLRVLSTLLTCWGMVLFDYLPGEFAWQMMLVTSQLFTAIGVLCVLASIAPAFSKEPSK